MKSIMKRLTVLLCLVALLTQMIPAAFAADLAANVIGEQVIAKEALQNLSTTEADGILKTADNQYLRESNDGGYIVMEKYDLSFANQAVLLEDLKELDVPDDLKQSIIDKYELLNRIGATEGVKASVYAGTRKINANGRSFYDDLPTITYQGRQIKIYTITYTDIVARETIEEGSSILALLRSTTAFSLAVYGLTATGATAITLGTIGAGLSLYDICQAALDFEITGSLKDQHWLDMEYDATEHMYYIYSDALSGWNRVLRTQSVFISELKFTTYLCHNPAPNQYVGEIADERTYRNLAYKTPSYDNPLPVVLQYQFLGLTEDISFKYQGKWVYF